MSCSGMSIHSCNKPDYHHRVKQLESRVRDLELEQIKANERIKVLEENLRILLSVKITDSDGDISLATNEERYQIARAVLEMKP